MDLALWFFGDLNVRSTKTNEVDGKHKWVETIQFELSQDNGFAGVCEVSWYKREYRMPEVGFHIEGSKGVLEVNDDEVQYKTRSGEIKNWYRHDLNDNVPFWLGAPEYFREDEYFMNCVAKNQKAEPCFESASRVDAIIEEVKRSLGLDE
jgi:predicted dehydrogenase